MKHLLYALLVSLFCCAATPLEPADEPLEPAHIVMHVDTDFTEQERFELYQATELWRVQTGGLADISLLADLNFNSIDSIKRYGLMNVIVKLDSNSDEVKREDCYSARDVGAPCDGTPRVLAWVSPAAGIHDGRGHRVRMAVVTDRIGVKSLRGVALHEFGHVLGLPHSEYRNAVMWPSYTYTPSPCLKQPDLVSFCTANRGCDKVHTSACE